MRQSLRHETNLLIFEIGLLSTPFGIVLLGCYFRGSWGYATAKHSSRFSMLENGHQVYSKQVYFLLGIIRETNLAIEEKDGKPTN